MIQAEIKKGEDLGAVLAQRGGVAGPDCTTNNGEIPTFFVVKARTI
jgi:hypothetical protein